MPAPQTTFAETIKPAVEGQMGTEWGSGVVSESRIVETAAGIGFGRAVSQGAGAKGCVLGGTVANFLGITIKDVTLVPTAGQTVDIYQRYDIAGVLNAGDIWVKAVNGCTVGATASFDGTTGQINPAAGGLVIPGSRWLSSATAGELALLRLTRANP